MPGMNKMGPMGNGPMTGRRMGNCSGSKFYGANCGRGMGRRFNSGAGFGRGFYQNSNFNVQELSAEDTKQMLENQKDILQSQLADINNQLEEI